MAEYKAYSPNAEVLGRAVLVVVYAMPAYEARVREFMTEEGIGGVGPDDWVLQQSWLNVLGKVTDAFGDYTLRSIGTSIPDHALFPPSVKDFRSAMEALDEAYYLNHKGAHFDVRGPLTVRRSPQGRPILVQAGQSETGRELAAETAEVIFTVQQDIETARAFRADIHARAARYGRDASTIKVMPGVVPFTGATRAEAQAKFDQLQAQFY